MRVAINGNFWKVLNPIRLTGPIFSKELRVSSRRRRNYFLRFIYLVLLTVFILIAWFSAAKRYGRPGVLQLSRLSMTGTYIVSFVVSFQFVVAQLFAIVMLSTSISEEIRNRTLGILMSTPINAFQIVVGKLLSKLLQLILLLAIGLPVLAVIRLFGGIPWSYVVSELCITLTAVLLAGSVSLFFSIHSLNTYSAILKATLSLALIYAFIPMVLWALSSTRVFLSCLPALFITNPFLNIYFENIKALSPGLPTSLALVSWPWHCGFMLALTGLVIALSVRTVRRVALRQAIGQGMGASRVNNSSKERETRPRKSSAVVRPVNRQAIIWKEWRKPLIQGRGGSNTFIGVLVTIIALLVMYFVFALQKCLNQDFAQASFILVFVLLGMTISAVTPASVITDEKERRCWPILLCTPMDDWQILLGKVAGILRSSMFVWLFLAGHILFFVVIRYIHPIIIVHAALLGIWLTVFLTGSGLCLSASFKHTTSAVVANMGLVLVLWAFVPFLSNLLGEVLGFGWLCEIALECNPIVQAVVVAKGAGGWHNARLELDQLRYFWPGKFHGVNMWSTTKILLESYLLYIPTGLYLTWRAKCKFRRNVF